MIPWDTDRVSHSSLLEHDNGNVLRSYDCVENDIVREKHWCFIVDGESSCYPEIVTSVSPVISVHSCAPPPSPLMTGSLLRSCSDSSERRRPTSCLDLDSSKLSRALLRAWVLWGGEGVLALVRVGSGLLTQVSLSSNAKPVWVATLMVTWAAFPAYSLISPKSQLPPSVLWTANEKGLIYSWGDICSTVWFRIPERVWLLRVVTSAGNSTYLTYQALSDWEGTLPLRGRIAINVTLNSPGVLRMKVPQSLRYRDWWG